jgi:hypothetical protein
MLWRCRGRAEYGLLLVLDGFRESIWPNGFRLLPHFSTGGPAPMLSCHAADNPMVFLPLLLIWLRAPMYFNAPSRWGVVLLAVSIALLEARRDPTPTRTDPPTKCLSAALPEHRWLHTSHHWTLDSEVVSSTAGGASLSRLRS